MINKIRNILVVFLLSFLLCGCEAIDKVDPVVEDDNEQELSELGYDDSTIKFLNDKLTEDNLDLLTEYDKVENIINLINNEKYDSNKLKDYLDSYNNTNNIEHSLIIVNNNIDDIYNEKMANILNHKYFIESRLNRYLKYESDDVNKIIVDVNSNLDYPYYTNSKETKVDAGNLMLVNKYYYLNEDFKGNNLVKIPRNYSDRADSYINKEVLDHFIEMVDAAKLEKLYFVSLSPYRSYNRQKGLYDNYSKEHGVEWANTWSAKPGYSEHQTGLALDVCKKGKYGFDKFETTDEYKWLKDNSYKYGFILRFPKGKEKITGYNFESWHYRYVGLEAAKYIYENDITLEEYYAYFVEK